MPYLNQLIEGYHRFRENNWASERERWSELAEGQSPQVMVLSCADSIGLTSARVYARRMTCISRTT